MNNNSTIMNISASSMVKAVLIGLLFWGAYKIQNLIMVVLVSVIIASAVEQGTVFLMKYKIPRVWSVVMIYLGTFLLLFTSMSLLLPPLFNDLSGMAVNLPTRINEISQIDSGMDPLSSITGGLAKSFTLGDLIVQAQKFILKLSDSVFSTASAIFGGFFSFILVMVISFYLSVQEKGIEKFLRVILPLKYEDYCLGLWRRSQKKIGVWFQGQIALGLVVGATVFVGLWLMGVKYAITLGIIAAIFEIIPFFGPILFAVPGVLLGFSGGATMGLAVLVFYIVVQQLESHVIYPLVAKKIIGVPPLIVILAILAGAELYGFLGIVVAVPLTTIIMELADDYEKHKVMGRQKNSNS